MSNDLRLTRLAPERRSEQIIEVAALHFARDGVANASMSGIARDAGVTRALVYHYFAGKESLLEAVLRREADRLLMATAPDAELSAHENIERALVAYFEHFAASRGDVRELYMASVASAPAVSQAAAANHVVQIDRLLAETSTPGTPERRLAFGAWLAFVEFTARHLDESGGVDRGRALEFCLTALEGILGRALSR